MYISVKHYAFIAGAILFFLDLVILLINAFFLHYPGNNYLPPNEYLVSAGITLLLIVSGLQIQFNSNHYLINIIKHVVALYLVMIIIALTTNAVQYSPFCPIDKKIVNLERFAHINLAAIMAWTASYPTFKDLLWQSYFFLAYEMAILPLIFIFLGYFSRVQDYLGLLLISTILGFIFYFFCPTTAPASMISSPFFTDEQYATGIKFYQIHHYIMPSTIAGGLIALPSYHVIWAWFCLYLARGWRLLFILLLPVNILIVIACVCLGWHYLTDIFGSFIVIFLSHTMAYNRQKIPLINNLLHHP